MSRHAEERPGNSKYLSASFGIVRKSNEIAILVPQEPSRQSSCLSDSPSASLSMRGKMYYIVIKRLSSSPKKRVRWTKLITVIEQHACTIYT